ncbi:MAG: isoleucine--tRNA ligase [Clostridia bacterium]|jgi:isoleucyl-tRNA synthetase|nr:isoleucine--tRNA ligase [Clostridiaceae bacterium]
MYKKVDKELNFVDRELKVLEFWKQNDIFKKSMNMNEGGPIFTFYDGPPTANGKPHIGHILTRSIKDIIPRYKTMKGYHVLRKAGWDTHGLPVELEVEKELGIDGKQDIEKFGVEAFVKRCKESVWKYSNEWEKMSDRVGFWADMENPYVTYHNEYIESVWWSLKTIWEKGLLYKGHKIIPYCPRCGTSLSSHEVAQGYKDVKEQSIYVKFKVKGEDNTYVLAWTTTPWTLPSNVALTVNPVENYAKVSCNGETYIMAEALLKEVLKDQYTVLEINKGQDLVGLEYEPLFDYAKPDKKAYYVVSDSYVQLTEGTGVVHCAPAFGEDDSRVGKIYDLPFVQLVNERGCFVDSVNDFAGAFVKDADPEIIKNLDARGLLFKALEYEHSYPFCWRCDTSLIYYAQDTWFIKMTAIKDMLVENNRKINWYPPSIGENRFGNFLENVVDWGLSRTRYWGTPLPIWECACGHRECIGSIEELIQKGIDVPKDIELHKPYIDAVFLRCEKCGGKMKRVTEVIDCWYDSGSMPFAQWHYPFENKELFEQNFPADFISEALDQTRGWFYTLHAISNLLFEQPAYKNCIVLGLVQDKDGQKMSKHKGNVVDPWTVLNKQGADAIRWYFYSTSAPWLPSRFYDQAVSEGQRKFMGTLWNTYVFYIMYADIDNFNPNDYKLEYDKLSSMDRWLLSKCNSLIKYVDESLASYKITESARALQSFTDELSNWYVRRSREIFWQEGMPQDKISAYMTLYTVLDALTKLSAPFTPFMAEEMYQNLVRSVSPDAPESVHLCSYPEYNPDWIDKELEEKMDSVLDVVTLGRACRNTANIKNRQPLSHLYIKSDRVPEDEFLDIIKNELNVKNVSVIDDEEAFITYSFKPQLKTVGPKYGKLLPRINEYLKNADGSLLMKELKANGIITFEANGQTVRLAEEDLLYETARKEGFVSDRSENTVVVLNTQLTRELIDEGYLRELLSKIQTMRKEADFEITDNINVYYVGNDTIQSIFNRFDAFIKKEVLAKEIIEGQTDGYVKQWDINGIDVVLGVKRV